MGSHDVNADASVDHAVSNQRHSSINASIYISVQSVYVSVSMYVYIFPSQSTTCLSTYREKRFAAHVDRASADQLCLPLHAERIGM